MLNEKNIRKNTDIQQLKSRLLKCPWSGRIYKFTNWKFSFEKKKYRTLIFRIKHSLLISFYTFQLTRI